MKQGLGTQAYTIIEVMIVLAVTSVLLVSAIILIAGQQRKTEFGQAVRDIESRITDTVNDVSTGFYPNTDNFTCTSLGAGPILSEATGGNQGANKDCIFIGRVLQFGVQGTNNEGYNSYTVVGQRLTGGQQVTSFNEAHPTAIAPSSTTSTTPNATQADTLLYGLNVGKMYINDSSQTAIGAFGIFSTFASYSGGTGGLVSGTTSVDLIPLTAVGLGATSESTVDAINAITNSTAKNPPGGISICFNSGGTDQHAIITIGANQGQLTTNSVISSGSCP